MNNVRGPTSYEDLKRINYQTFRDAYYALGLLDDDKEHVDAIVEASHWGMPSYLRELFAILLLCHVRRLFGNSHLLSEDILHEERRVLDNPGI